MRKIVLLGVMLVAGGLCFGSESTERPGPLADGSTLLNNGWKIRPAGQQIAVGTFPMSTAASSDGKYLLVLNGGREPGVSLIDLALKRQVGQTTLQDAWLGLVAAPSGNLVYAGGGSSGKIYELTIGADGALTRGREFTAAPSHAAGAPFIGDVALSPDGRMLYAADLYGDTINVINVQSGKTVDHWKTGRRPYRILVSPNGSQLLISSWADGMVYEHESGTGILTTRLRVGAHPTDMLWLNKPVPTEGGGTNYMARLFVTASNTNNVFSFGVTADGQFTAIDTINVSMTPMHPLGMTPSALAVDSGGARLFVACSDANVIAVADLTTPHPRVLGTIPTGWYPTAVRALEGNQLAIVNGKGTAPNEQSAKGSVTIVSGASGPDELRSMTETALADSPYHDDLIYGQRTSEPQTSFSRTQEHPSPIHQVIYVIKGSQTYDSVLGDLPKGNGDKGIVQWGTQTAPNLHALASEFVLYDNFYAEGETSVDGEIWATAAIATDFAVKLSANATGNRNVPPAFVGSDPANLPPAGYLWGNALQAGLSVRNFGESVTNVAPPVAQGEEQVKAVQDLTLVKYTDRNFRGFDPSYKDSDRVKEFVRAWRGFDANGQAPQLNIVKLSNDDTPSSAADNDAAIGLLVDAVSHSKLWSSTAIFIVPAAAKGADHVSRYRAPAWVISPFTLRGSVDSTMYNQTSVLRAIELILGLRPMTHFDAGASTMFADFNREAVLTPFVAATPK